MSCAPPLTPHARTVALKSSDATDFLGLLKDKMNLVEMHQTLLHRAMNEGLSGGERKRNAILQMAVLDVCQAEITHDPVCGMEVSPCCAHHQGLPSARPPSCTQCAA